MVKKDLDLEMKPPLFEINESSVLANLSEDTKINDTASIIRIGLAGGGTGGHVYPALAVKERLDQFNTEADLHFTYFGSVDGAEAKITADAEIDFIPIKSAAIRTKSPYRFIKGIYMLWKGTQTALRHLREESIDVIFATGGYASAPICRAAAKLGIPIILFLPDVMPGWAVKFIAKDASLILCSNRKSLDYLDSTKSIETGYPVRSIFQRKFNGERKSIQKTAKKLLDLNNIYPTVLVAGGSTGSRIINDQIISILPEVLNVANVIHVTGKNDYSRVVKETQALVEEHSKKYIAFGYSEKMEELMAAADLGIFRGGASVIGEASIASLPSIVIPGLFSDQSANAEVLRAAGAAIVINEQNLDQLGETILHLISQPTELTRMTENISAVSRPYAAEQISSIILKAATTNSPELPPNVHLVGAGGIHLSGIGEILLQNGHKVTGSDLIDSDSTRRLAKRGAKIHIGHSETNIGHPDLVVTTAAAKIDNPELKAAREKGIPIISRAEMVNRLISDRQLLAVAGSHGKTTTSSLATLMAQNAGLDPIALIGGNIPDLNNSNVLNGRGQTAIVEADEYADAFLSYKPSIAVITNVDPDHLDYFGTEQIFFDSFKKFTSQIVSGGVLLVCADDEGAINIAENTPRTDLQMETYSVCARKGDWYAQSIEYKKDVTEFDVFFKKQKLGTASIKLVGQHNVGNFLAALAGSMHAGVDFMTAAQAARTFRGARRRFELVGEITIPDGPKDTKNYPISVIDDYAHHPTEIRATILAAKNRYPNRRIIACFQPHTFSRTKYLLDEFKSCFEGIDSLLLLKTFAAREDPVDGLSARDLANLIENIEVSYVDSIDQAVAGTVKKIKPGDVFISIGAGDVTRVPWLLLPELQKAAWSRAIGDDA